MRSPRAKKFEVLVKLDHFSKFLKYFQNFEKQIKITKSMDFFAHGERATLSHHFEPSYTVDKIFPVTNEFEDNYVILVMISCPTFDKMG